MIKWAAVLVGLIIVCAKPAPVLASSLKLNLPPDSTLSCGIPGEFGDITWLPGVFPLVGSCLNVGSITGLGTEQNSNVTLTRSTCLLDFNAGTDTAFQPSALRKWVRANGSILLFAGSAFIKSYISYLERAQGAGR